MQDVLTEFMIADIAACVAVALVLVLRSGVRALAGARIAYGLWLAVPAAAAATLLPSQVLPAVFPEAQAVGAALAEQAAGGGWLWASVLPLVWIGGAVVALAVLMVRQRLAVKALGALQPAGRGVTRTARAGIGPVVIGALFPRIVLPAGFEQTFDAAERKLVLAHEQAHVDGRHVLVKTAAEILVCLNWFNPLAYIASAAIARDQEFACDEAVARRFPAERRAYALALVKSQTGGRMPLGCFWPPGSKRLLKARIARLAASAPGRARRGVGLAAVALTSLAAGYTAWAQQPGALHGQAGGAVASAGWTHCKISVESAGMLKERTHVLVDWGIFSIKYYEIASLTWDCDDGSVDTERPVFSVGSETSYRRPPKAAAN